MSNQVPSPRQALTDDQMIVTRSWWRFFQGLSGLSSVGLTLTPSAPPAAPAAGWTLYVDASDADRLKAIDSAGGITVLAP